MIMPAHAAATSTDLVPSSSGHRFAWPERRPALVAATLLAIAAGSVGGFGGERPGIDADLARVLQFMAVLKLAFAAMAFLVSWWRLARPVTGWRSAAYVVGPPLAVGGSILLLSLHHLGTAALTLHGGLFALAVAALSDTAFFEHR